jgi:hypothetical protein
LTNKPITPVERLSRYLLWDQPEIKFVDYDDFYKWAKTLRHSDDDIKTAWDKHRQLYGSK